MASDEVIVVEVARLFQSFGGRVADGSVLLAYDAALAGDACTDYQLQRAVTEAVVAGGAFPPSAGDLRKLARSQPRDPQAAIERKRRESQSVVIRTPLVDAEKPHESVKLLESSVSESFEDKVKRLAPGLDVGKARRREQARKAKDRVRVKLSKEELRELLGNPPRLKELPECVTSSHQMDALKEKAERLGLEPEKWGEEKPLEDERLTGIWEGRKGLKREAKQ